MTGLVSVGRSYKNQAKDGLSSYTKMQDERNRVRDSMDLAEKNERTSMTGMGLAIGMMAGGPIGAAVGAGVGLIASELF